jgi:hypothetical protein
MRSAFADQGVTRREWRLLNLIENGPATIDELKASMPPRRHGGKVRGSRIHDEHREVRAEDASDRPGRKVRRSTKDVIDGLVQRGWVSDDEGRLSLTEDGTRAKDELSERVSAVRITAGTGITDADYATTLATLEVMARNLGWSEDSPRPHRRRRGFRG